MLQRINLIVALLSSGVFFQCKSNTATGQQITNNSQKVESTSTMDTITLGGGCFWCIEAVFRELNGVQSAVSGYSGGKIKNPTYREVCSGLTGHAEVVQVVFDTSKVSLEEVLEVFFTVHDPTTLNRQGADVGTQYRSVIYYHNPDQQLRSKAILDKLNASGAYSQPIVTELSPFTEFYSAEAYHQDYFNQNSGEPYCRIVIQPKLDKFRKVFDDKRIKK